MANFTQSNSLTLIDHSGNAFDSDESPAELNLSDFSVRELEGWVGSHTFRAQINTLALVASFAIPGDYNVDGIVSAADYVAWRNGFGTIYTQQHYETWRAHFGQTASGGRLASIGMVAPTGVPEPSGTVLMLAGVHLMQWRGRPHTARKQSRPATHSSSSTSRESGPSTCWVILHQQF
jgi:hypothetical protein